ncbi:MAG: hypothetical protein A3B37_03640 [Candidatus Sungbacteria bacterium RIFCSPLOWO2_01_FULL_59_16]|uniref:Nudix hydrolase domain-containing protein n=1 Tax=Candidatus Sungbacteria bacterium RIFCSPLOWO2_01_FULL_59_16 TaxID=1802280 RepID=A0A1G2L9L7_9BACT|nr:MAG: hypothetical protein A3B37_03640 [Candidatus Sungbacteria bacterium RIFCSPLOWO2_01_FULL_59_16]
MKRKAVKNGLTRLEVTTLVRLLGKMPPLPNIPRELFILIMQKNVPVTIELAIMRAGKLLLTHRRDAYFKGWHFPGRFMGPGETIADAVRRTALREIGLKIQRKTLLGVINCVRDRRFHFISFFFLCSVRGRPKDGAWFSKCPPDLIPEHKRLWKRATEHLRRNTARPLRRIEEMG